MGGWHYFLTEPTNTDPVQTKKTLNSQIPHVINFRKTRKPARPPKPAPPRPAKAPIPEIFPTAQINDTEQNMKNAIAQQGTGTKQYGANPQNGKALTADDFDSELEWHQHRYGNRQEWDREQHVKRITASRWAQSEQIKSRDEWIEAVREGRLPPNIHSNPEEWYDDFHSSGGWPVFLKLPPKTHAISPWCPIEVASQWAQKQGLSTEEEWRDLYRKGGVPPEIPENPEESYGIEWMAIGGFPGFLGGPENVEQKFLTLEETIEWMRARGIHSIDEWETQKKQGIPVNIPEKMRDIYGRLATGWGRGILARMEQKPEEKKWPEFKEAAMWAQRQGIRTLEQWRERRKMGLPGGMTKASQSVYKEQFDEIGGWEGFFGNLPGTRLIPEADPRLVFHPEPPKCPIPEIIPGNEENQRRHLPSVKRKP